MKMLLWACLVVVYSIAGGESSVDFTGYGGATVKDSLHLVKNYKKRVRTKIHKLWWALLFHSDTVFTDTLTQIEKRVTRDSMRAILKGIRQMELSQVVYEPIYRPQKDLVGYTEIDTSNGHVLLVYPPEFDGKEEIGHEIRHCIQYERGEISMKANGKSGGTLFDITDETDAYKSAILSHTNVKQTYTITDTWVKSRPGLGYDSLQPGPISLNSEKGNELRRTTFEAGKKAAKQGYEEPHEYYIGWEQDYTKGKMSVSARPPE